jgi:hypothetical protein
MSATTRKTLSMNDCEQCQKAPATVYAIDPLPGGWGGYYCIPCQEALRFQIVDRLCAACGRTENNCEANCAGRMAGGWEK